MIMLTLTLGVLGVVIGLFSIYFQRPALLISSWVFLGLAAISCIIEVFTGWV